MSSRQPGRRAIIVASIIGLCITLIWAAAFRVLYLSTHPLGAWEQSTCRDTVSDASTTLPSDNIVVAVHTSIPSGYRSSTSTHDVICVFRSSDGALLHRLVLPYPQRGAANFALPNIAIQQAHDVLYMAVNGHICAMRSTDGSELWCHTLQSAGWASEIAIADDVVIVKTHSMLEAIDAASGSGLWHDNLNDTVYLQGNRLQTFAESAGTIYVGHNDPLPSDPVQASRTLKLCSQDAHTGARNWCQPFASGTLGIAGVVVGGGIVFAYLDGVSGAQQFPSLLYALRASDGKLLWHQQLDCSGNTAPIMAFSPASNTVSDNVVLITTPQCRTSSSGNAPFQNEIMAVRAADGTLLWKTMRDELPDVAVAGGVVYLDTLELHNGQTIATSADILALRLSDASQVWHTHISSPVTRLAISGDMLYAMKAQSTYVSSASPASLVALRRADGGELWQATSCSGLVDPLIWHDHLLSHEQGAPVWCRWPATNTYFTELNPVLP